MPNTSNRKMVTVAMLVAILLVAIDVSVVSTATPKIIEDLKGLNLLSWVFAIYTLTTAVTTPIYGKLADLFGRKKIFIIGVILFVVGSILCGAAQSMHQLIWFRAFQGIGAGAVMPITFTIIGDIYPGEQRAKMQGLFSSVWGVAGLLGPLVGGLFVDQLSWRWIFYINLPIGIISLILILKYFHETIENKEKRNIDYIGATTFTIAISALLFALLNGGSEGYAWNSMIIISFFVIAAIFLALFIYVESKVSEPMLPSSLFTIPSIVISNLIGFLFSFVLIGVSVYLPMWIQVILGHSATSSGLTLMPMSLAWPLGATFAGRYMYKIGAKFTTVVGAVFILAGTSWLLAVSIGSPYWYFVGVMLVIGLGMGYVATPTTVIVQSSVGWKMRGAATASNNFMKSVGQTIGVAVFGMIFNHGIISYMKENSFSNEALQGDFNTLIDSQVLKTLPEDTVNYIHQTMAGGLHTVFIGILIFAVLTLAVTLFLPSHKKIMEHQKSA